MGCASPGSHVRLIHLFWCLVLVLCGTAIHHPPAAEGAVTEYPISSSVRFGAPVSSFGQVWSVGGQESGPKTSEAHLARLIPGGPVEITTLGTRLPQSLALSADGSRLWLATVQPLNVDPALTSLAPGSEPQDFPGFAACGRIVALSAESTGTVWYASNGRNSGCLPTAAVGKREALGVSTSWPLPADFFPKDLIPAAEGGVWVLGEITNQTAIVFVSAGGDMQMSITSRRAVESGDLALGPDGRPWFGSGSELGHVLPDGTVEFRPAYANPDGLAVGPDGALWMIGYPGYLARLDTASGEVCTFPLQAGTSQQYFHGLTAGPDGNLWYTASRVTGPDTSQSYFARFALDASVKGCRPVNRPPPPRSAPKKAPRFRGINLVRRPRGRTTLLRFGRSSPRGGQRELALSASGRYLAFSSSGRTFTRPDNNGTLDVFVYDRARSRVTLASHARNARRTGSGTSSQPAISASGRRVAFASTARNLIANDTNRVSDVFVFDRRTRRVRRASVANNERDANGPSDRPAISADGRYVAFWSAASNLVPNDRNGVGDVFVRDLVANTTRIVSVSSNGIPQDRAVTPLLRELAISANGERVAFVSAARNLAQQAGRLPQVYLRDLRAGTTTLVSASATGAPDGASSEPRISGDGRRVIYSSRSTNQLAGTPMPMGGILLYETGTRKRTPVALDAEGRPLRASYAEVLALSSSGRYLLFSTVSPQALPRGVGSRHQILLTDLVKKTTEPVSVSSRGTLGNANSYQAVMSEDARAIVFTSSARNLLRGSPPGRLLIYVRKRR